VLTFSFIALRAGWFTGRYVDLFNAALKPTYYLLIGTAIFCCGAALVFACARGHRKAMVLLIVFAIADCSFYGLRHKDTVNLQRFINGIDIPPQLNAYRIAPDPLPDFTYSRIGPLMRGAHMTEGHSALPPLRHYFFYNDLLPLRLAGTGWMRTTATPRTWIPIGDPMPPARLVSKTQVSTDFSGYLAKIDMRTAALLDTPLDLPSGTPGTAEMLSENPGEMTVRSQADTRQLLVLTTAYHAGWHVVIDGQPAETRRVFGDFLGCIVEQGAHQLQFTFAPASYFWGWWISLVGAMLTLLFMIAFYAFARHNAAKI
jgi:hypothetical protein